MIEMTKNRATEIIERAEANADIENDPFRIVEVSEFLPPELLSQTVDNFPSADNLSWETSLIGEVESKRRTTWTSCYDIPEGIKDVVEFMNSSIFLKFASDLLEIPKLLPDPYFTGGGLNESFEGDYLDVHVDGNYHDASGLNRRANAILYLTEKWDRDWGGNFGMYVDQGNKLHREIVPEFNKLILFDTSDTSYHGYPEPIKCPSDVSRRSLILYYYTKDPQPSHKITVEEPHSALWVKRNLTDRNFKKTREHT